MKNCLHERTKTPSKRHTHKGAHTHTATPCNLLERNLPLEHLADHRTIVRINSSNTALLTAKHY